MSRSRWREIPRSSFGAHNFPVTLTMQESLHSPAAARVYIARWALRTGDAKFIEAFAPRSGILRQLLLALPVWLLACTSALLARLLLGFMTSREITDGNVNFSFAVRGRAGVSLFVKQARAYLKWQPQMSLERERMVREVRYFGDAAAALAGDVGAGGGRLAARFLPAIHGFDEPNSVLLMELLDRHTVLFEQLFATCHVPRSASNPAAVCWVLSSLPAPALPACFRRCRAAPWTGLASTLGASPGGR